MLGEVGEDFVDRFAGGSDELGEFLLSQVVGDAQRTVFLGTEPVR